MGCCLEIVKDIYNDDLTTDKQLDKKKNCKKRVYKKLILENEKIPNIFQLNLKINLNYSFIEKKFIFIDIIHELSNQRIGILSDFLLLIYSLNTFKQIDIIRIKENELSTKPFIEFYSTYSYFDDTIKNFIELYNGDIIIYTSKIILIYELTKKGYKFLQKINGYNQGTTKYINDNFLLGYYCLYSVHEFKDNNNFVSCNSYGLKFYTKQNDKYVLISKYNFEEEIIDLIEIKDNIFILIQKKVDLNFYFFKGLIVHTDYYAINLYDFENKKVIKKNIINLSSNPLNEEKYFLFKNEYFIFNYDQICHIYNLKNNFELESHYYNMRLINKFFGDLFIFYDKKKDERILYKLKNGKLIYYETFPFQNKDIIILNNRKLISYYGFQIKIYNCF